MEGKCSKNQGDRELILSSGLRTTSGAYLILELMTFPSDTHSGKKAARHLIGKISGGAWASSMDGVPEDSFLWAKSFYHLIRAVAVSEQ